MSSPSPTTTQCAARAPPKGSCGPLTGASSAPAATPLPSPATSPPPTHTRPPPPPPRAGPAGVPPVLERDLPPPPSRARRVEGRVGAHRLQAAVVAAAAELTLQSHGDVAQPAGQAAVSRQQVAVVDHAQAEALADVEH